MFVDEKIEIIVLNATKKYYKNLGYDISNKRIYVKIEDIPKESHLKTKCLCDKCDTETFISIASYYKNYNRGGFFTCKKCSIEYKTKKTNIIKYGVDNPMKNKDINNKAKETLMNNWGVDVPLKNKDIRNSYKNTMNYLYGVDHALQNEKIKDKIKKTNLERYGVEYASQSIIFKNKTKNTNLQRYDVEYVYQSEYFKKIKLNSYDEKWGGIMPQKHDVVKNKIIKSKNIKDEKKIIDLLEYSDYKLEKYKSYELEISHNSKNHIFSINTKNFFNRLKYDVCLCTKCYPISEQQSIKERELIIWLKESNIDFIESDKTILNPKHLDIYIQSKKIGIEFNGLYHHSEYFKDKNYHLDKSLKCQEQGIQLLHIWEDEWIFKKDIVKSIILNKLDLIKNKIYARQTEVRIVEDSKLVRQFLDENHIQGYSQSSIKLGLFNKDNELISLMTFGYRHTNSKKEFELIRFCNKINMNVIGASSKLFNFFKKNYEFNDLISYSDFRLFDGKMYEMLGFTKQHLSKPDYFWCKNLDRKHRFNFNKQKLIKEGFDGSKTEVEIMHERGYYRIFGCGQYRWVYLQNNNLL